MVLEMRNENPQMFNQISIKVIIKMELSRTLQIVPNRVSL